MKLLKQGLCSAEGGGDDLGSVEAGELSRLGGDELSRLPLSDNCLWCEPAPSSDFPGGAPLALSATFTSERRFLFRRKLPLSNIFSQLGSSVQ